MPEERWLVDGMLGRIARYLRFLGYDTVYAPDRPDPELASRARSEGRRLLTRDRLLAAQTPGALLLRADSLRAQLRELALLYPPLTREVRFVRCSACNGLLEPESTEPPGHPASSSASDRPPPQRPRFVCRECGHLYWEGSHTDRIRRTVRETLDSGPSP
jgi:uncharacterized protein with PIN domain